MIWVRHILVKRAYTTAKLFLVSSIHWSPQATKAFKEKAHKYDKCLLCRSFEPRIISSLLSVIIRVSVVLKRTVVAQCDNDRRFNNLGSFCYWTLIRSTNSVWVTLALLKTAYIHLIQKWRPIYYSFLCIYNSLTGIVSVCKIQKNFYSKMRPVRLILKHKNKRIIYPPPFMNKVYTATTIEMF